VTTPPNPKTPRSQQGNNIGHRLRDYGRGRYTKAKRKWPREHVFPYATPDAGSKPGPQPLLAHRKRWPWAKHRSQPVDKRYWISAKEAANLLNCTRETLRTRYFRTNRLPYVYKDQFLGNGWRIRRVFTPRPMVYELLARMILSHAETSEYKVKRGLAVLSGLDDISRELSGEPRHHPLHKMRFRGGSFESLLRLPSADK
jgi:hypothetical protein